MLTLEEATERFSKYFSEITCDQFIKDLQKWCPEILEDRAGDGFQNDGSDVFECYNFFPEYLQFGDTLVHWKKEEEAINTSNDYK